MTKTLVSLILVLISGFAQAGIYYDSKDSCMSAGYAGKAVDYKPTAKHKKFGDARIAKHELRRLESDACVLIGAVPGKRWAFLKEGNNVLTKGTVVKMLAECQNDIYEIHYLKKDETIVSTGTSQPEIAPAILQHGSCTTDDCGNTVTTVTNKTIVQKIVEITDICRVNGVEIPMTNGKCVAPAVTAVAPVKVESHVTSTCLNCTGSTGVKPASTKPVAQSECIDCNPELKITGKVARTDGRCVLKVKDEGGEIRFIRFGTQDGGHLSAVRVTDETGDNLMKQFASMVGYDDEGGKATAKLPKTDCPLAIKAFSEPRALKWTALRLGLKQCLPLGQV